MAGESCYKNVTAKPLQHLFRTMTVSILGVFSEIAIFGLWEQDGYAKEQSKKSKEGKPNPQLFLIPTRRAD